MYTKWKKLNKGLFVYFTYAEHPEQVNTKRHFRLVVVKEFGGKRDGTLLAGCELFFWNDLIWQMTEVLVKSG